jgi:hypothetical protein
VAPATVRVALIVWLADKVKSTNPAEAGAVTVKLLKVFAPVNVLVPAPVPRKRNVVK